ncbi:MAG TPA: hypothetical protein VN300_02580 [Desulfobacterales bacterium]|nr:hypothetical protein [Desulfobacterales bacterium]
MLALPKWIDGARRHRLRLSLQLRLGGFYTRTAFWITSVLLHPRFFLLVAMLTSAVLSAVLAVWIAV